MVFHNSDKSEVSIQLEQRREGGVSGWNVGNRRILTPWMEHDGLFKRQMDG